MRRASESQQSSTAHCVACRRSSSHKQHGIAQLVWLKVECPPDGSLKQLMHWILEQVDAAMGSNYRSYMGERSPVDERMALVGRVLEKHFTGLLVIDEIQERSSPM